MNQLQKIAPVIPWVSLAASFVAAAVASYILVAHFQHTILAAWTSSSTPSSQALVDEATGEVAVSSQSDQMNDFICGCPFCCGIVE
jgi:hypothetical protein